MDSGKDIEGVKYYSSYEISEQIKEIHLSENSFFEPTEFDVQPAVYFRLAKPLKADAKLPVVDLSKLYLQDPNYKF